MTEPRAFYRSYHDGTGKRAGQVRRLHVLRKDSRAGYCGIQATNVTNSHAIVLNVVPILPPEGLTWCGKCVAALARRAQREREYERQADR